MFIKCTLQRRRVAYRVQMRFIATVILNAMLMKQKSLNLLISKYSYDLLQYSVMNCCKSSVVGKQN